MRTSFLDLLICKKALVHELADAGLNVRAALTEVDRQIRQASKSTEGVLSGIGVTKSNMPNPTFPQ